MRLPWDVTRWPLIQMCSKSAVIVPLLLGMALNRAASVIEGFQFSARSPRLHPVAAAVPSRTGLGLQIA